MESSCAASAADTDVDHRQNSSLHQLLKAGELPAVAVELVRSLLSAGALAVVGVALFTVCSFVVWPRMRSSRWQAVLVAREAPLRGHEGLRFDGALLRGRRWLGLG
jgi:hypothetical protein